MESRAHRSFCSPPELARRDPVRSWRARHPRRAEGGSPFRKEAPPTENGRDPALHYRPTRIRSIQPRMDPRPGPDGARRQWVGCSIRNGRAPRGRGKRRERRARGRRAATPGPVSGIGEAYWVPSRASAIYAFASRLRPVSVGARTDAKKGSAPRRSPERDHRGHGAESGSMPRDPAGGRTGEMRAIWTFLRDDVTSPRGAALARILPVTIAAACLTPWLAAAGARSRRRPRARSKIRIPVLAARRQVPAAGFGGAPRIQHGPRKCSRPERAAWCSPRRRSRRRSLSAG
jgi:hypothetical protein